MVDRYATNQFYNFSSYEESIGSYGSNTPTDNPLFLWPKPVNKNAVMGTQGDIAIQRGYMRMITEAYGTDTASIELGKRRLHFQFNPDTLTRQVTARNDVQLWQNQDPFQFIQPIPGDSNFSFQLLFNREAEVASASYKDANGNVVKSNKAANFERKVKSAAGTGGHPSQKRSTTFEDTSYKQSWVTDIGVLADLMVFDQIIGQGMNQDLIQKIISKAQEVTSAYNLGVAGDAGTKDQADQELKVNFDKASTFLGTNIGNSAFLVAQPIRVVFSSSFMVEGFVTSTTVMFNKFNSSMIPTQCQIDVQMQAMYIGFANKDTYLTQLFKEYKASEAFGTTSTADDAQNKALKTYGNGLFTDFQITNSAVDLFKYNLNPERILNNDGDGVSNLEIKFIPSSSFVDFAKGNLGTVSSTLQFVLTYKGRTSGSPSGGYVIDEVVHRGSANADFDMSKIKNGITTVTYKIENPTPDVGKRWDTASNAKYQLDVIILYHLTGASGGDVDGNQVAKASKAILTYREVWRVANDLNTANYTDDQIAQERSRA